MEENTLEVFKKIRNMGMENSSFLMAGALKVCGMTTCNTELECLLQPTAVSGEETGSLERE